MQIRTDIVPSDVFISWTGKDVKLKERIVEYLSERGISCLESVAECIGDIKEWSTQAVGACSLFLAILSPNTLNSTYVPEEVEAAKKLDDYTNRIIPVCESNEFSQTVFKWEEKFSSNILVEGMVLTEEKLEEIYKKTVKLLINRFYLRYREKVSPSFVRLVPLWSKGASKNAEDFSFEKVYIKRQITERNDENEILQTFFDPTPVIKSNSISLLCGQGGCGKSQYLNHILSYIEEDTLPFIVSCEKFYESGMDLFSYLYNQFYNLVGRDLPYSENNFKRLISCKKLLLMFDGLDELASESATRRFVGEVESFYKSFDHEITLIFTSRNKKDSEAILINGRKATNYFMEKLSEDEIRELSYNLFVLFENEAKGEEFYGKIKEIDDEIKSNPLLLTQLAIVYNSSGEMPKTSYGILSAVTDVILKIDDEKGLINNDLLKNLRSLLKRFAKERYILTSCDKKVEAVKVFKHILKNEYVDYEAKAEFLSEYLKNRAILVDGEFYHKMFLEFFTAQAYYDEIFDCYDEIENVDVLDELITHYENSYWAPVIQLFLMNVDFSADENETVKVYDKIANSEAVCEYTLLFDVCRKLERFSSAAQTTILKEILEKSANETYPPYGPLFYYVPEYELYCEALKAVSLLSGNEKALALVRDVLFIFGQFDRAEEVLSGVNGKALYEAAKPKLSGVRDALCELFYTGKTDFAGGDDIYPKCFNVKEAKSFMTSNHGVPERMIVPFEDELSLFSHKSINFFNGELIGLVSCLYEKYKVESLFKRNITKKVTAIIFAPTGHDSFTYLDMYRKKLRVIYFPEDCVRHSPDYNKHLNLNMATFWTEKDMMYVRKEAKLSFPGEIGVLPKASLKELDFIEELVLEEGFTAIERGAFNGCRNLVYLEIPESVVFDDFIVLNKNTREVVLPDSHVEAFIKGINRRNVEKVIPLGNNKTKVLIKEKEARVLTYADRDDIVEHEVKLKEVCEGLFENCVNLKSAILPMNLRELPSKFFYGCKSLEEDIQMPTNLTVIGESAFEGCTKLWHLFMPGTIESIKERAFKDCVSLKNIHIPNSIRFIHNEAFMGCTALEEIHLPPGIEYLSPTAFEGCTSLKRIKLCAESEIKIPLMDEIEVLYYYPKADKKGVPKVTKGRAEFIKDGHLELNDPEMICMMAFNNNMELKTLSMTEEITKIPRGCFSACCNLEKIEFSDAVIDIGKEAFEHCNNLSEVALPKMLRNIRENAFRGCTSLKKVVFGKRVLAISSGAFNSCTSLEELVLPRSVRSIARHAFINCTSLKSVLISANFEDDIERIFGDIDKSIIKFYGR